MIPYFIINVTHSFEARLSEENFSFGGVEEKPCQSEISFHGWNRANDPLHRKGGCGIQGYPSRGVER